MSDPGEEQGLRKYLTSAGGFVHEDVSLLANDAAKGRKVVLNAQVAKGTELLRVPVNICFFHSPTRPAQQVLDTQSLFFAHASFLFCD